MNNHLPSPPFPVPIPSPLPSPPLFPFSGLTPVPGGITPGMVVAYGCDIDAKTYERTSGNCENEPQNFSPTEKNNTGWILCDGSSAYEVMFPRLFNIIGYVYGKGETEGQFKVPDYRGFFMRGLDTDDDPAKLDPGLDKRKPYANGAKGQINGASSDARGVGSTQECMVQMHEHHYDDYPGSGSVSGAPGGNAGAVMKQQDNVTYDLLIDNKVVAEADAKETRPVNIYVNYLVYSGLPCR